MSRIRYGWQVPRFPIVTDTAPPHVARRDALSLSVLAAEWQPMFDEPDGFVCLFLPDEEGWR